MTLKKMVLIFFAGLFVAGCSSAQKDESVASLEQETKSFDRADRIGSRAR